MPGTVVGTEKRREQERGGLCPRGAYVLEFYLCVYTHPYGRYINLPNI